MSNEAPRLVTGAAGRLGGVGGKVVEILRGRGLPVRALVRCEDDRAALLRATGAEVVVGDLTRAGDVARALQGCRRMYFGMSVSAPYLEATVTTAAVALQQGDLEVFVNISQLTVSQMSLAAMTDSLQQRLHWLGEQALNWSRLPVVHVYIDVPFEEWRDQELRSRGLPDHVFSHMLTMAQLQADNRYDRLTQDFQLITGRPATSIRDYATNHPEVFGPSQPATV